MKNIVAALFACVVCGAAVADPVMLPSRIQFYSDNGRCLLEIVPTDAAEKDGWKRFEIACHSSGPRGSGRVIGSALWRSKGWYSFTCYVSDDGRSVVQIDELSRTGFERLIRFWRDGIEIGSFTAEQLVPNLKDFGPFEMRHWLYGDAIRPEEEALRASFTDEHRFRFKTVDGIGHVFDFATFTLDGRKPNKPAHTTPDPS